MRLQAAELQNVAVAQVGDQVITSRQVWISNFYERWKLTSKSLDLEAQKPKADWKVSVKSESFRQSLNSLILEYMVAKEAENFSIAEVSGTEVEQMKKNFLLAVSSSSDWKKFETSESEVQKLVERKIRAQNFLNFKTEAANVVISDQELQSYYDKNRLKFGQLPFAQFKTSIREVLSRQILEERLKDWFEVLKRKYRVKPLGLVET